MFGFKNEQETQEVPTIKDTNGDQSDSDTKSNSSNKRGKYRTYTDDEKATIINFVRTIVYYPFCSNSLEIDDETWHSKNP